VLIKIILLAYSRGIIHSRNKGVRSLIYEIKGSGL